MYNSCFNEDCTFNMPDMPLISGIYRYKVYRECFPVSKLLRGKIIESKSISR